MSRASPEVLDALHGLLAGALKDELAAAIERSKHPDPEKRENISPQLFDKVMKFLKDNGVDAPQRSERVTDLTTLLTDLNLDEAASVRPN